MCHFPPILSGMVLALLLTACGGGASSGPGAPSASAGGNPGGVPPTTPATAFSGDILLGAPEDTRIRIKLLSMTQSGSVQLHWGRQSSSESRSAPAVLQAGEPLELTVDGLQPDAAYRWKLSFTASGASTAVDSPEYRWQTARRIGSTYTFTIQADSHLDENSDLAIYQRTLDNIPLSMPDFHIDLGDTFMTEKHSTPLSAVVSPAPSASVVNTRYIQERGHFARFGHSVPLFLVNGNHDAELGWAYSGQADSLPVWATQARKRYFLNPLPGAFYSGDLNVEPYTGERAAWYAWRWGDAQFIVLDPFWNSRAAANRDPWNITLGERQYRWLEGVLQAKTAAYTFVFIHNLVGGSAEGQMRGGTEADRCSNGAAAMRTGVRDSQPNARDGPPRFTTCWSDTKSPRCSTVTTISTRIRCSMAWFTSWFPSPVRATPTTGLSWQATTGTSPVPSWAARATCGSRYRPQA